MECLLSRSFVKKDIKRQIKIEEKKNKSKITAKNSNIWLKRKKAKIRVFTIATHGEN